MDFTLFKDFAELKPIQLILFSLLLVVAVVCAVVLFRSSKKNVVEAADHKDYDVRALVNGALCIALGFVLSYLRLFHMPQGGSLTIASMLPVMVYSYWYGPKNGILAGIAYGALQYIQDPFFVHPVQLLLDYGMAFGALGLVGLFKKHLLTGITIAGLVRILCHLVSGAVFFAQYAPEGQNAWVYSATYNLSVIGPDLAICIVVAVIPRMRSLIEQLRPANKAVRT